MINADISSDIFNGVWNSDSKVTESVHYQVAQLPGNNLILDTVVKSDAPLYESGKIEHLLYKPSTPASVIARAFEQAAHDNVTEFLEQLKKSIDTR